MKILEVKSESIVSGSIEEIADSEKGDPETHEVQPEKLRVIDTNEESGHDKQNELSQRT